MPIDFNTNVTYINPPQIIRQEHKISQRQQKDVFVKNTDKNFDGIKIEKRPFGKIKKTGEKAELYTITNRNGASVDLSSFGATITAIRVPDKNGKLIDVTQGYNSVTPYEESPIGHAGGTIGPYANKISNGSFTLGENFYQLECNKDNGKSHSHGGKEGLDVQNWNAKVLKEGIEFSYLKKDDESGYPGDVLTKVTYKFDNDNNLHIYYNATSDKDTIINLTNHTYFNLDGAQNAEENSILSHLVKLPNSTKITKINEIGIPTGEFLDIENTPFDFREEKILGKDIDSKNEQMLFAKGYDHNFCIDGYDGKTLINAAEVKSNYSGIKLKVSTNLPGFQFYSANNLGKTSQPNGKNGKKYEKRSGFCIEPQFYPNAINTETFREKGILKANEEYSREIIYSFEVE